MPEIVFGKATTKHAPEIALILSSFKIVRRRSEQEITKSIRDFFIAKHGDDLVGCVALRFAGSGYAVLESLAVKQEFQGKGTGSRLVELALKEAKIMGIEKVVGFTKDSGFLKRHGFSIADTATISELNEQEDCNCKPLILGLSHVE